MTITGIYAAALLFLWIRAAMFRPQPLLAREYKRFICTGALCFFALLIWTAR